MSLGLALGLGAGAVVREGLKVGQAPVTSVRGTGAIRVVAGEEIALTAAGNTAEELEGVCIVTHDNGPDSKVELAVTTNTVRTFVAADRKRVTFSGWVTGGIIRLRTDPTGVKRGQIYGSMTVVEESVVRARQTICRGYVHDNNAITMGDQEGLIDGKGLIVTNEGASTLVSNTALTRTISVPTNARWELEHGHMFNGDSVNRGITYNWDDGTEATGGWTSDQTADSHLQGTGRGNSLPWTIGASASPFGLMQPVHLSEGHRIQITWAAGGASAGGTARSSAVVKEWIEI